jgi:hypothetical protein
MNLRSGCGSTSARAGRGLGEGQDESGRGNENDNEESHEALLLGPPPPPPPPPLTYVKMMAEMLAACRESTRVLEMMAQAIGGLPMEAPVAVVGTGVVPATSAGPVPTRTS